MRAVSEHPRRSSPGLVVSAKPSSLLMLVVLVFVCAWAGEAHAARWEDHRGAAFRAVDEIDWPEGFCRRDIGWRALAR